jgi:hypothetical protein
MASELLNRKLPFAVIIYRMHLKGSKDESSSEVELLYLDDKQELHHRKTERAELVDVWPSLTKVLDIKAGQVYEYGDFANRAKAIHGREGLKRQLRF